MGITTFAAIDVGSYNVCMDIYEMSPRIGIRQIDKYARDLKSAGILMAKARLLLTQPASFAIFLKILYTSWRDIR